MKTIRVKAHDVIPNPNNPRKVFDRIEELAASFDSNSKNPGEPFTPPLLVKNGSFYMIIDGERRFRAMKLLGIEEFEALVADDMDEADSHLAMLATNDKQQLTDQEKSRGIQQMLLLGIDPVKVDKASGIKGAARAKRAMQMAGSKAETMSIDHLLAIEEFGGDERLLECKEKDWQGVYRSLLSERTANEKARVFREAIEAIGGTVVDESPDTHEWTRTYVSKPENVELADGCVFTVELNKWAGRADCYRWVPRAEEVEDPEAARIRSEAAKIEADLMAINDDCDAYQALNLMVDRKAESFTAREMLQDYLGIAFRWTDSRRDNIAKWRKRYSLPEPKEKGLAGIVGLVTWFEKRDVTSVAKTITRTLAGSETDSIMKHQMDAAKVLWGKVTLAFMDGYDVPKEARDSWCSFSELMEREAVERSKSHGDGE